VFAGIRQWLRDNPRIVFLILAGAVILGLFLGVISPLFATTGPASADLSGVIPATAAANQRFEVDISIDNTGDSIVSRLCVGALVQGAVTPVNAIFQNVDTEAFVNGRVCGGELTAQSSAPVQLFFKAGSAGTVQLVLSPMNGTKTIGAALTGSVSISGS
jgi:hypothetical protein